MSWNFLIKETSEECFELDGENAYQQQSDRAEDIIVDHVDMNRTVFVRESICLKEEEKVTSYEIASSQTDIEDDQPVLDMTQTKQSDINSAVEMQNLLYTGVTYSKDKCLPRKELLKFTVSDYDDAIMQDPQMNTQLYGEQENDGIALNVVSGNVLEVIQCEGIPFTSGIEETVVTTNGKDDMLVEAIDNNYGPDTSTTGEFHFKTLQFELMIHLFGTPT